MLVALFAFAPKAHAATLFYDTFSRTVSNGWGTSDSGFGYSSFYGLNSSIDVNGSEGEMVIGGTGSTGQHSMITSSNSVNWGDLDVTMKFKMDKMPDASNKSQYIFLPARRSSTGEYRGRVRVCYCSGYNLVQLTAVSIDSSNVETTLGGETQGGPGLMAADTWWNVRMQVFGTYPTTIQLKAWQVGQTEPSSWNFSTTDSLAQLQINTGKTGLISRLASTSTNAPVTFTYDDYTVNEY